MQGNKSPDIREVLRVSVAQEKLQKIIDVKSNGISSVPKEKNINVKVGHLPLMFFFENSHKC